MTQAEHDAIADTHQPHYPRFYSRPGLHAHHHWRGHRTHWDTAEFGPANNPRQHSTECSPASRASNDRGGCIGVLTQLRGGKTNRCSVDGEPVVVELKYPKERFVGTMLADGHPEEFDLASSGAPGDSAITFWKDLSRIETLIESGVMKAGAAVVLSNCHYWKQGAHGAATQVYDFRLWEGRELPAGSVLRIKAGTTWAADASAELRAHYCCEWHPYSDLGKAEFRYLVLEPH